MTYTYINSFFESSYLRNVLKKNLLQNKIYIFKKFTVGIVD